jgi:hypothetical protein
MAISPLMPVPKHRMKRGFLHLMAAQFFSSLADNALFIRRRRIAQVVPSAGSGRLRPLVPMFALFYVVLAPFRGARSRPLAQGQGHVRQQRHQGGRLPDDAVRHASAAVLRDRGLGAAAYSPAKYGILTEAAAASQLVKANGWIEGLTIAVDHPGHPAGGQLVGTRCPAACWRWTSR